MKRLQQLNHELTGVMTARLGVVVERPADEPPTPWWWTGDDDATYDNMMAMQQLSRPQG